MLFVAGQANSGDMVCSIHKLRLVVLFASSSKNAGTNAWFMFTTLLSLIYSLFKKRHHLGFDDVINAENSNFLLPTIPLEPAH